MYGALDISVSGMIAQRERLLTHTVNLANKDTIQNGKPFLRREIYFARGNPGALTRQGRELGVQVAEIREIEGFTPKYEPGSPYADEYGYVKYPDVNPIFEQMNAYEAQRSYEANLAAAEATKAIISQALRLIA